MSESDMDVHGVRQFAAGLIIGVMVGAGIALLVAPASGADARRTIRRKARHTADRARDRYDELRYKVRRARREAADAMAD